MDYCGDLVLTSIIDFLYFLLAGTHRNTVDRVS